MTALRVYRIGILWLTKEPASTTDAVKIILPRRCANWIMPKAATEWRFAKGDAKRNRRRAYCDGRRQVRLPIEGSDRFELVINLNPQGRWKSPLHRRCRCRCGHSEVIEK